MRTIQRSEFSASESNGITVFSCALDDEKIRTEVGFGDQCREQSYLRVVAAHDGDLFVLGE